MKSVSEVVHKTPWWVLLASGLALAIGLAVFVTPFHLINLEKSGQTPEERQAIKREVDLTFSEGAIDIARGVVREMRRHARDPARQEELDQALEQIDEARSTLREAGAEVLRAKREAGEEVVRAASEAERAISQAKRDAAKALERAGVDPTEVNKKLEEAAKTAAEDTRKAGEEAAKPAEAPATATGDKPKRRIIIGGSGDKPIVDIDLGAKGMHGPSPLTPAERAQIREKVTGDLWRIGVGAGLILIFIPLFILTVVSKFFIDRSRAAQRMAELKRKEAEYHRMSQQVTEAKLSALQAQVEPHFLYNTLASVQALTEVDPGRANEMTGTIEYLRNALPKMREQVSTVGQEVELVRAYLNILQMRMGKRLAFAIDVPAELMELPFPPLMLPSLVENAIKHGLEPMREGGEVRITAEIAGDMLRIAVADTGRGFGETVGGTGVGLTNICERLAAMYGDRARFTLEPREPRGVVAAIEIPRDGVRLAAPLAPEPPPAKPQPEVPQTKTARTLAAMGNAERAWRKSLSFTFVVLVVVAAVIAGLAILGIVMGLLPVNIEGAGLGGPSGALVGAAGIAAAFAVVVLALAIVLAVVYGLGFLFVGLAIFIPLVVLVSLFPLAAPFLLVGLGIWWLVRRHDRKLDAARGEPAPGK